MSGADKQFLCSVPVLLVDVDGVISLFGFDPSTPPPGRWLNVEGVLHLISTTAGEALRNLARDFELVWCTGWEEKASAYLPQALGLPGATIHLSFDRNPGRANAHWKLAAIEAYAGPSRPVAWVDDALDERCRAWAQARPGRTLLVETDPAEGLTAGHVAELRDWAQSIVSNRTPSAR
ncbi:MAG TPA: HAD domain-containing protein [Solirubrobacteraceae bacterium]|nr:HAD domain-containing protein [Solirubrobacteraceae bacterium]